MYLFLKKLTWLLYDCFLKKLFKQSSFYFLKLFLAQVPKQLKRCFIYFFDCTTYYFWSNALYFCSSRFDYLINSFFCDLVDIISSIFNNILCDFSYLVDCVSSSVCKIVTAKESASLFTSFFFRKFFQSHVFRR